MKVGEVEDFENLEDEEDEEEGDLEPSVAGAEQRGKCFSWFVLESYPLI